ncbi:MAG: hypothetical protein Q9174_004267, partial [Haloplaca sp. 1 TL-2023]
LNTASFRGTAAPGFVGTHGAASARFGDFGTVVKSWRYRDVFDNERTRKIRETCGTGLFRAGGLACLWTIL